MDHHTSGGDGLEPIAGDPDEIARQAAMLTDIATFMDDGASRIRQMGISDWSGDAADLSWDLRLRLAAQCVHVSNSHAAAAAGLWLYCHSLRRLQPLGEMVIADARMSSDPLVLEATRLSLRRWRTDLASVGNDAADQIGQAAEDLEQLRRVLPELATIPPPAIALSTPATSQEPVRARDRPKTPAEGVPSVFAFTDPTYAGRVAQLNAEIFFALREDPTIRLPWPMH